MARTYDHDTGVDGINNVNKEIIVDAFNPSELTVLTEGVGVATYTATANPAGLPSTLTYKTAETSTTYSGKAGSSINDKNRALSDKTQKITVGVNTLISSYQETTDTCCNDDLVMSPISAEISMYIPKTPEVNGEYAIKLITKALLGALGNSSDDFNVLYNLFKGSVMIDRIPDGSVTQALGTELTSEEEKYLEALRGAKHDE